MKFHFTTVVLATVVAVGAQQGFQAPAMLVEKEGGGFREAWLVAATKTQIRYRDTEQAVDTKDARVSDFGAIYVLEPRALAKAMDLFESRKYAEAREAFKAVKEAFKPIQALDNSPGAIAAFHEMECMRKMGDLDALAEALKTFVKDPLTRESQLRQIELYVLWDAARTKSWDRLEILARERDEVKLPGDQRAQVGYLHGLALEGLKRPNEALFAYGIAMTADAGASEDIARDAALRVMAIHLADPEVQQAMKVWGTPDEDKNSRGRAHLQEAGAVASLFEIALGGGAPLPGEYKKLLEFKPQVIDAAAPEVEEK